ncbi:Uma2 family endonuclease [Gemmata sp. JC673]|uniref:Uma2 family endonuclease n=1 Tax=Gemmata algarum TaxID=2975278 RepID=A0ABU5F714_9BACT|nr:Uma2 family endonuclease [Gemmata algarum]MDY3561656.1 Uma2 family endonuclease [Gemmata algarum]
MSALLSPPPWKPSSVVPQPRKWTVHEFDRLGSLGCFEGRRAFLLDGVILEQGPMDPPHATGLALVDAALRAIFGVGWLLCVQTPLHLDPFNNPMPDLAVVPGGPRDYATVHPTVAALVVEVSDSTLHTDLTAKAERYATAGIADYWVLDLNGRVLHVLRDPQPLPAGLGATAYRTHLILGPGDSVAPLAAPAAALLVADLLP